MKPELKRFAEVYHDHGLAEATYRGGRHVCRRIVGGVAEVTQSVVRPLYQPPSLYYHSKYAEDYNIFTEEWDLLIVLDTCRVDALRAVAGEYEFISDINHRWSVGANSSEWLLNTFSQRFSEEISNSAYITSNPHAATVLENQFESHYDGKLRAVDKRTKRYTVSKPIRPGDFARYVPLYDRSVGNVDVGYPDPRVVTDHAINVGRNSDIGRIIVHYMPPHLPYIAHRDQQEITIGTRRKVSFEAYIDNLRWGLNEVELLLNNIDADRVVITADHGENFKLRSLRAEHKPGMVTPAVRRVPWAVTTATDTGEREPDYIEAKRADRDEMLEALGYR